MHDSELTRLYRAYSRPLYNFILWMTVSKAAADDILQTAFVKVWRCDSAPADPGALRAWLFAVARNACLDHFRAQRRSMLLRMRFAREHRHEEHPSCGDSLLWQSLTTLGETERCIVFLHIKMGYPMRDIARMMDLTETNVKVKLFRAMQRLRKHYAEQQP